jgi:hypothetical protein
MSQVQLDKMFFNKSYMYYGTHNSGDKYQLINKENILC